MRSNDFVGIITSPRTSKSAGSLCLLQCCDGIDSGTVRMVRTFGVTSSPICRRRA